MTMSTSTRFTRDDYMKLPEGFPAQLVEGCLVKEPSPAPYHQDLALRIVHDLLRQVGEDRIRFAPLDLFLDDENVYQPDVMVFDRPVRVGPGKREMERPVLVVEILSPSTAPRDRGPKARRYLAWGVREVWLVDPDERTVEVRSTGGSVVYGAGDAATSTAAPEIELDLARLFRTG